MSAAGRGGIWESARTLTARMPLRVKLISAVLALVAVALAVISVAALSFLSTYYTQQADSQLDGVPQRQINGSIDSYLSANGGAAFSQTGQIVSGGHDAQPLSNDGSPIVIGWLPAGGHVQWLFLEPTQVGIGSSGQQPGLRPAPAVSAGASWLTNGEHATVGATAGSSRYRMLGVPVSGQVFGQVIGNISGTVIVGLDVSQNYRALGRLTGIDLALSGILLLLMGITGAALIRASLRPLGDIERTAEAIAAGDLARRVPAHDPRTEVGRLSRSLNVMLAQIETAFRDRSDSEAAARRSEDKMRQFIADASHELRTPLTAIRGFAEYYRQRGGVDLGPATAGRLPAAELDRIMRRLEQEASRMGILVEDLLLLARLDQQRPLEHRTVDLLTLAADAVHDARVVAPGRDIHLTVTGGRAMLVLGDEVRLRQVIGNLMSNAMAHTPDGTPIDIRIRPGSLDEAMAALPGATAGAVPAGEAGARSAAVLEVADHGQGLSPEQAGHVFERFYRADQARTSGGTGLGLAIVAALVAAHGGAVWVESVPGQGATFRIALPLAPEALNDDDPEADYLGEPGGVSPVVGVSWQVRVPGPDGPQD
jgi:two-component system OmpR family sensor kinase